MPESIGEQSPKKGGCLKKIGLGLLGLVGLIIILVVIGGGKKEAPKEAEKGEAPKTVERKIRFKDRPDAQPNDIEILPGESAELEGLKLTIKNIQRASHWGEFQKAESGKEFVVMDVLLENVSGKTQSYNELNFRIQTAGGQVLSVWSGGPYIAEGELHSGDLIKGGKVEGTIGFEIPKEDGHQYILYKPNAWKPDRIVVQIQ